MKVDGNAVSIPRISCLRGKSIANTKLALCGDTVCVTLQPEWSVFTCLYLQDIKRKELLSVKSQVCHPINIESISKMPSTFGKMSERLKIQDTQLPVSVKLYTYKLPNAPKFSIYLCPASYNPALAGYWILFVSVNSAELLFFFPLSSLHIRRALWIIKRTEASPLDSKMEMNRKCCFYKVGEVEFSLSSPPLKIALCFVYSPSTTTLKVTNFFFFFFVVLFMHSGSQLLPADLALHLQTNKRCRACVWYCAD